MDRSTFSTWGSLICVVLVVAIMMAFATPFGRFVTEGVKSVMSDFKATADEALNVSDIGGGNGGGETPDNPSNPDTPDEPTTVTFTIDGTSYTVNEGTTWSEWTQSANGLGWVEQIDFDLFWINIDGWYVGHDVENVVLASDVIVAGDYILV